MTGIFDSLVKGLSELAPQDDPTIKIFQAKNSLKEIAEKESSLFSELGRQVYQDGEQTKYPEIASKLQLLAADREVLLQRIQEAEEVKRTREKNAVIKEETASTHCTGCGAKNSLGTKYCRECGTKLNTQITCSSCGATLLPNTRFCSECGERLSE